MQTPQTGQTPETFIQSLYETDFYSWTQEQAKLLRHQQQRGIIEGTLKRQKYFDIAESYGCTAGHAKDVGYELLQMLSDVFGEPVDKRNLKSVLERQANLNISFGDKSISSISNNIIGCINVGSEQPNTTPDKSQTATPNSQQRSKNQIKIKIDKLRQFGLSDEQIAQALELPLEMVKQEDLEG